MEPMEPKPIENRQESFTVDVAHAFETMADMVIRLEKRIIALEETVVMQHQAMGMLSDAVRGHQKIIEAQNDWKPIALKSTSVN